MAWYVYILRCADDTLYTGITTDVARRLDEHNSGTTGARYTRARRPVAVIHVESASNRAQAARREAEIKRLERTAKLDLIGSTRGPKPAAGDNTR